MEMSDDNLTELPKVGPSTADKLREAGYNRYKDIAIASVGDLTAEVDGMGDSKAQSIIDGARDESDVGGFTTGSDALEARKDIGKITTGVDGIDEILEGGIEEKAITEMYGEFKTGKSQLTHQLCVNVQLPEEYGGNGKRAIFIDTEDSFRPERIEQMVHGLDDEIIEACMERDGVDGTPDDEDAMDELAQIFLDRVHYAPARNVSMQIMLVDDAKEDIAQNYRDSEFPVGLLVVDSIMGHFRAEYTGRGELAKRQQTLTQHMDDLTEFANQFDASVVLANQVQANPDQYFGDPTKPSGGNVIGHRSTFRVKLRHGKKNKRVFMLEDAPNLPDGQETYLIEEGGIKSA